MFINRVIPGMATFALEPRENAYADIEVIVVITKVEVAVSRTGEQIELKCADIYCDAK